MATALEAWLEAGRLLEHLPGLHDQRSHGRRFNIPGDAKSGLRKTLAGEHRAHAAHSVADAVDDALDGLDLPERHKSAISRRARAAADEHGPHPSPRPKRAPARKSSVERAVADADNLSATTGRPPMGSGAARIEAAKADVLATAERIYGESPDAGHRWIGMADLRDQLGAGHSRDDVDAAILDLVDQGVLRGTIVANTKALSQEDRDAAIGLGGTAGGVPETIDAVYLFTPAERAEMHRQATQVVDLGPSPREELADINAGRARRGLKPMDRGEIRDRFPGVSDSELDELAGAARPATTVKATFAAGASSRMSNVLTPQDAITRLRGMDDRAAGEQLLARASKADLLAILTAGEVPHHRGATKATLRSDVIEMFIGRRLDSAAIERAGR